MVNIFAEFPIAVAHHRAGRLEDALRIYRNILAVHPDQPETRNNCFLALADFATALAAEERYAEVLALFREALAILPGHRETLDKRSAVLTLACARAAACQRARQYGEAARIYEEIRAACTDRPAGGGEASLALYEHGVSLIQRKNYREAVAPLEDCLAFNPWHRPSEHALCLCHMELAKSCRAEARRREAHAHQERAEDLNPHGIGRACRPSVRPGTRTKRLVLVGNCQTMQIGNCLRAVLPEEVAFRYTRWQPDFSDPGMLEEYIDDANVVVTNISRSNFDGAVADERIVSLPTLQFAGFHPDIVHFKTKTAAKGPLPFEFHSNTASALALWALRGGRTIDQAEALFSDAVFSRLGYYDCFDVSLRALEQRFEKTGLAFAPVREQLCGHRVMMFGGLHPKMPVSCALAKSLLEKLGIRPLADPRELANIIPDPLESEYAWGCYPPIAAYLGVEGSWACRHSGKVLPTLRHYLEAFYATLSNWPAGDIVVDERDKPFYDPEEYDAILGGWA